MALCLVTVAAVVMAGEEHIFLGPNGSTVKAEVLDFRDGNVEIRRLSDGQLFRLPANQLSVTDAEFMRGWLKISAYQKTMCCWLKMAR